LMYRVELFAVLVQFSKNFLSVVFHTHMLPYGA
jgi:hypothetical protein